MIDGDNEDLPFPSREVANGGPGAALAKPHWRHFRLSATGIEFIGAPPFAAWSEAFADLTGLQQGVQWWIGDMLVQGEARYGERYAQVVEATGYAVQTLMNITSVAGKVPREVRRLGLSFSHHREVAAQEPGVQDILLRRAEENGWSSRDLADAVRAYKSGLPGAAAKNLPARVGASAPESAAPVDPEPETEEPPAFSDADMLAEIETMQEELTEARELIDALQTDDKGREITNWAEKCRALQGRITGLTNENAELRKQLDRRVAMLEKIRKAVGAERDSDILAKLKVAT